MLAKDTARKIEPIIEPTITHLGYELVRVALIGTPRYMTLQIMAEPAPTENGSRRHMTVEDCETISRTLSAVLDVADPISAKYSLEVSSPGIDRPLTKPAHFSRFAGQLAQIDLTVPTGEGRKRFQGVLARADEQTVTLTVDSPGKDTEPQTVSFDYDTIAKAKLVLTDELIKAGISA